MVAGASRRNVHRPVTLGYLEAVGAGLRLGMLRVALGLVAAVAVGRPLASLLSGVGSRDPRTLAAVAVVFPAVALAASARHALRAGRVDPVSMIRERA
jgi:hypothetical protein